MVRSATMMLGLLLAVCSIPISAQQDQMPPIDIGTMAENSAGIAQQARNPLADTYTLQLQYNTNFGVGPNEATVSVLNIQPYIPITLSDNWNLIVRPIIPIISQPALAPGLESTSGLGDTVVGTFFSPRTPGKWTWGAGPALLIPTATDRAFGNGKWGLGPTATAVRTEGPWIYGALLFQVWSFDNNNGRPDVNRLSIQPFANYIIPNKEGWYVVSAPIINANFEAPSSDVWTVPVGLGVGRVFTSGTQRMDMNIAAYYNVIRPENGAEWQLRMTVNFIYPR